MDQGRVAEADVHAGLARHAFQGPVQGLDAVFVRLLGPGLHVGLVQLHVVRARREQVHDLLVHRCRVIQRRLPFGGVVIVLGLLGHGERARHGHLDGPVGIGPQEPDILDAHRVAPPDRAHDARHVDRLAAAVLGLAGIVQVDAVQRGGEVVGVALAANLAVRHDVQAGALLVLDGDARGIILRFLEPGLRDPPELQRPRSRGELLGQLVAVDQPVGLRVAANDGAGEKRQGCGHDRLSWTVLACRPGPRRK